MHPEEKLCDDAVSRIGTKPARTKWRQRHKLRRPSMMDLLFLIVAVGFFAAAIAYVHGCERL